MSKRARQMALMGFVTGALGDVMRRREQSRLEEAEARKEARLAAIRAEERAQDFALRKELTQAELAQRAEMAREEMNAREKLTTMEVASREKISAADNAARLQANREDNATRIAATRGGGSPRNPEIKSYINEATGKVVTFDVNNADDLSRLKKWQESQPVRPYYASSANSGRPPAGQPTPARQPAAPAPVLRYNPKTGRVE